MSLLHDQQYQDSAATPSEDRLLPMQRSRPIEVDGILLGAAIEHELCVRFVAADDRVNEMDQSIWPNLDYASRSARQLFKSTRAAHPL
jgi:hypothetical protein